MSLKLSREETASSKEILDIFELSRLNNHREVVHLLEEAQSESYDLVNERDSRGRTALHISAACGANETTAALLRFSADVSLQDWVRIAPYPTTHVPGVLYPL